MPELKKYPIINKQIVKEHGISSKEYKDIVNILITDAQGVSLFGNRVT